MSAGETTHFRFNLHGLEVEISGNIRFVDQMYREVMSDIQSMRTAMETAAQSTSSPQAAPAETPIWIHRCSEMMRKIYMTNAQTMRQTMLAPLLDLTVLRTIYIDKSVFDAFLPALADENTLWAELTDEGRRTIQQMPRGRQPQAK